MILFAAYGRSRRAPSPRASERFFGDLIRANVIDAKIERAGRGSERLINKGLVIALGQRGRRSLCSAGFDAPLDPRGQRSKSAVAQSRYRRRVCHPLCSLVNSNRMSR